VFYLTKLLSGGIILTRTKPKYSEENLSRNYSVHRKSNADWPGIKSGTLR
jgi:hypothetical protein